MTRIAAHEPRIAKVAAMMADPARSLMLAYLLSGEMASAGELASAASVTAATASGHLSKLLDVGLLVCEVRGRHRYYKLANADVAHALEALAVVAERSTHEHMWEHPARKRLRFARCCYGHLAGEVGVKVLSTLQAREGLKITSQGYELTPLGLAWMASLGLQPKMPVSGRRYAYPCLDWSERRDHLAGQLANELLAHFIQQGWLRQADGRALDLTPKGVQALLPMLS
ncbi:MAG: transcriptional regulator [Rubrivivax sp.]|nr:MAG: transcriptional regulator [Rubrivivax sp.]